MHSTCKDVAIKKIIEMPKSKVSKILIFMAGMEAEREIDAKVEQHEQPRKPPAGRPA